MSAPADDSTTSYRVTLRDVDKKVDDMGGQLADLRTLISERIPQGVDERLRKVEAQVAAQWVVVGIALASIGGLVVKVLTS